MRKTKSILPDTCTYPLNNDKIFTINNFPQNMLSYHFFSRNKPKL